MNEQGLTKFLTAQERDYQAALTEIRAGQKTQPLDVVYLSADCGPGL